MTNIIAKRTKTIATKIRSNKLSYFKCIKFESTKNAFVPAIKRATDTVNGPKCIEVTAIVINVRNKRISRFLMSALYSIVCVVLFAMAQ